MAGAGQAVVIELSMGQGVHLHPDSQPNAPLAVSELSSAPASPPTAGVPADGSKLTDVGSDSGSTSLHIATSWVNTVFARPHPKCAKWIYGAIFLVGIFLAMNSRDSEVSAFSAAERINGCEHDRYCLSAESALRIFFTFMFITTVWTKKIQDWRNFWNCNLVVPLFIKLAMVAGCLFTVQFISSNYIQVYGTVARFGSWLFLVIQLIAVTRFIMSWNIDAHSVTGRWRCWLLQTATILLNLGSFGAILYLMHEDTSNILDLTIVGITLMLMVLMLCIHLKSEVTTSWLAPGMILAYTAFMCWTIINSAPHGHSAKAKDSKGTDWLTIVSFIFGVIVMAYSTLGAGEDHEWIQFNAHIPSTDDIPYGYGYFHLVFALGSMYFGMILVGWNAHQTLQRWTMDFGWWSAVVRAVNGLLAAALYIWMLRTPFIWNKKKVILSWSGASTGTSLLPSVTFV